MPQSLPDPQALRNLKFINPILRNWNFKKARLMHFCPISMENPENQAKMLETCFLKIAISQDWVNEFQISQSLWVREALEHILRLSRFHNSCKKFFVSQKLPKFSYFFSFILQGLYVRIPHMIDLRTGILSNQL